MDREEFKGPLAETYPGYGVYSTVGSFEFFVEEKKVSNPLVRNFLHLNSEWFEDVSVELAILRLGGLPPCEAFVTKSGGVTFRFHNFRPADEEEIAQPESALEGWVEIIRDDANKVARIDAILEKTSDKDVLERRKIFIESARRAYDAVAESLRAEIQSRKAGRPRLRKPPKPED